MRRLFLAAVEAEPLFHWRSRLPGRVGLAVALGALALAGVVLALVGS